MRYLIVLIILIVLLGFLYYLFSVNKESFEDNEIITNYKCNDTESEISDLKINKAGEYLNLKEAVERATQINRLDSGESYEGIYKNGNDFFFCKNVSNTREPGNVLLLQNTVDGDILMKGQVGVKTGPIDSLLLNNEGTLFVKDQLCLQKENKEYICLTSDDIYRLKNRPVNIPREKELCLSKHNSNGIEEQACVDKSHFKLLNGGAMASLKHMDYSRPQYGANYVKYSYIKNHDPHVHYRNHRQHYGRGMNKNYGKGIRNGEVRSQNMSLLQAKKGLKDSLKIGFDINKPWGRKLNIANTQLKTRR
jgi:hypothetical protein